MTDSVTNIPLLSNWLRVTLAIGITSLSLAAHADEKDQIVTDRPDFVESSNVVGKGRFQIETSVAVERNNANGYRDRTTSTPTLLRFGITDTVELRLETDGRLVMRSDDSVSGSTATERGYADMSIGAKWHLFDAKDGQPSVGLLGHIDLASGSVPFRGTGARPSLRLAAEWDLPGDMSLGVMPGLIIDRDAQGERYAAGIFGIVLGKEWTEKFRSYAEISLPQIARSQHGGNIANIDVGVAYLLTDHVQVDLAWSHRLNRNAPQMGLTAGLSLKF